jgi:hypothetical protein
MLIWPDEHNRPLVPGDLARQPEPLVKPGRDPQLQDADQLVHRRRRPRAAENNYVVIRAADRLVDHLPGVLAQSPRLQPGCRAFGMRVGVPGQHRIPDEVLDEVQGPA